MTSDPDADWVIVYASSVVTLPTTTFIETVLRDIADALLTKLSPDSAGWNRPFQVTIRGWSIDYRVEPTKRRIVVTNVQKV
jgi:hypothetical protein